MRVREMGQWGREERKRRKEKETETPGYKKSL